MLSRHETDIHIRRALKAFLIVSFDMVALICSFFVTYLMARFIMSEQVNQIEMFWAVMAFVGISLLSLVLFGAYKNNVLSNINQLLFRSMLALLTADVVCLILSRIFLSLPTYYIIYCFAVELSVIIIGRLVYFFIYKAFVKAITRSKRVKPVMIIGAGFTGKMVCNEIVEAYGSEYIPVCFVDDNESLISKEICGLKVFGPTMLIPELCRKYEIKMVVFAIPSCPKEERERILRFCREVNCEFRIIPSLQELTSHSHFLNQSATINVDELLGRDVIRFENDKIRDFIAGKVCLVTGGGGSIGSEICRQIAKNSPEKIVIVDNYENNAYEIQQELLRSGFPREALTVEIATVRDYNKMHSLFSKYRFQVIFHAAAHKHVPLMEDNPEEAVKNNIIGTYHIAKLADLFSAEKMVLISTDKAVNPTNVMGASKRVCEMIMQHMSQQASKTEFVAVRFGNVLGSNGSVIPLFSRQIEEGGPVTVTHPDIIRYFMTIPESVSLVLQAATMARGGEIFVLDMGKPVKIVTLAENLIRLYGFQPYTEMPIKFCGLRPGEKLFEELLMDEEGLASTANEKIFIGNQIHINCKIFEKQIDMIRDKAVNNERSEVLRLLHEMVPTYKCQNQVKESKDKAAQSITFETTKASADMSHAAV